MKFFRTLKEINPVIKIILSSGFSGGGTVQQLLKEGAVMFLPKPFNQATLIGAVKKVLGN